MFFAFLQNSRRGEKGRGWGEATGIFTILPPQVSTLSDEIAQESLYDHRLSDGLGQRLGCFPNQNPTVASSFLLSSLSSLVELGWARFSLTEELFG